ncbi:MAG: TAT-variant-translocated molybdopterin oxidoreductase [Terriglobales bacterium]
MADEKKYWKSLEERDAATPDEAAQEFAEELPRGAVQWQRRDFLKVAGFTTALGVTAGCSRAPVQKAIPLLVQGEENVPGHALQYATTCAGCSAGCGVLATVRDGRPIKLEGNPAHPLSRGGLCAVGQAQILGLYDSHRLQHPLSNGKQSTWPEVDAEIQAALDKARADSGAVCILTGTQISPTRAAVIAEFVKGFRKAKHVTYDALSHSAILDAHERTHAARILPRYRFEQADVIVSFDADFLGTWISPVEFTAAYRQGRRLDANPPRMSWHVQFESRLSLTGSKADERYAIHPRELGAVLAQLAQRIATKAGARHAETLEVASVPAAFLDKLADRLWDSRGRSLIVSGSNDVREQVLVNYLNHLLGNYGTTLDAERPSRQAQGSDAELAALLNETKAGRVAALLVADANPAFELPDFAEALKKVPLVVSFAQRLDETATLAHYVCPEPHFLESWSDTEPVSGDLSVTQPTIRPLGDTRPLIESLAAWMGRPQRAYDLLRERWRREVFPRQKAEADFDQFWNRCVHDGHVSILSSGPKLRAFNVDAVAPLLTPKDSGLAVVLYPALNMLSGREGYNAWLHELPDPITKVAWDNYASLSPKTAAKFGVSQNDIIRVTANERTLELPVYVQPGQHDSVIAIALGYGSVLSERFDDIGPRWIEAKPTLGANGRVGRNAAPLLRFTNGALSYSAPATVSRTGKCQELACTQTHHTLTAPPKLAKLSPEPRPIIRETTLVQFAADSHAAIPHHEEKYEELWPADHAYSGPRWGMVIDLEACTGCSGCVIACQAENNVPVVGKDEVRRNREMHWLRVDRYFTERADGRIDVACQPMVCQQCEHAPCETVCPVLATVHSEDGLNQQVYNRCVGTRYCANNCPYKGRRFNWFNYNRNDALQNLALNPDVAVRSRGVMEKCTFCVQRIQAAKIEAKRRGARIADGDVQTACQQSCPARAIHFGDLNDPASEVSRMMRDPRRYRVLAELGVKPSVGYLAVVRNRDPQPGDEHHG